MPDAATSPRRRRAGGGSTLAALAAARRDRSRLSISRGAWTVPWLKAQPLSRCDHRCCVQGASGEYVALSKVEACLKLSNYVEMPMAYGKTGEATVIGLICPQKVTVLEVRRDTDDVLYEAVLPIGGASSHHPRAHAHDPTVEPRQASTA